VLVAACIGNTPVGMDAGSRRAPDSSLSVALSEDEHSEMEGLSE